MDESIYTYEVTQWTRGVPMVILEVEIHGAKDDEAAIAVLHEIGRAQVYDVSHCVTLKRRGQGIAVLNILGKPDTRVYKWWITRNDEGRS